jgi:hypothetical protein
VLDIFHILEIIKYILSRAGIFGRVMGEKFIPETVFLNFEGAKESISRN